MTANLVTSIEAKKTIFLAIFLGAALCVAAPSASAEEAAPVVPAAVEAEAAAPEEPAEPTAEALIQQLRAPVAAERVAAVRALGERQERSAVPHLITLLRADPLPEVRGWIIRALDDIDTPEAHSAIVTAAREDPDERVRTMAGQLEGVSPAPPQPFTPAAPRVQPTPVVPPLYRPARPQAPPRPPGRGLRVAGVITTSVSYGLALLVGLAFFTAEDDEWDDTDYTDWGWKMILPIVGPAVAATTNDVGDASAVFWLWSAAQVAGVTLLAIGYARRARWLRENESPEDDVEPESARRSWGLAVMPGPGGLMVNGYF